MPGTSTGGKSRRTLLVPREWFRAWWRRRVPFAISVGLTVFALTIYLNTFIEDRPAAVFSFVNRLELDALDLRFRLRPDSYKHPDPRIIIVDIDQRSQEILGRWPFSRTYFAQGGWSGVHLIVYGLLLIAVVLFLPRGAYPALLRPTRRRAA